MPTQPDIGPLENFAVVTKNNTVGASYTAPTGELREARALYVTVAGDVAIRHRGGTITITGLAAGVWHPIRFTDVLSTGTTATGIIAGF